jgi:arabinofuranan 3-O-arabinosyltransferase
VLAREWRALAICVAIPVAVSALALAIASHPDDYFRHTLPYLISGQKGFQLYNDASLNGRLLQAGLPEIVRIGLRVVVSSVGIGAAVVLWRREYEGEIDRIVNVGTLLVVTSMLGFSVAFSHYTLFTVPLFVVGVRAGSLVQRRPFLLAAIVPMLSLGTWPHDDRGGLATRACVSLLIVYAGLLAEVRPGRPAAQAASHEAAVA